jgi:DNA mismatch repair protein MutS
MSTPVRSQYLRIKKRFPDTIVFFRLGDFYETFDDDAAIVSSVCDIVLTSRPIGNDERVPLAGVPYHAVDTYLSRLISAGYKVAIVEQTDEQESRQLMGREVVRVVTPGTVIEPVLLQDRRNNYLAALAVQGDYAGIAYADITTGEFRTTQWTGAHGLAEAWQEVARLQPAELLVSDRDDPSPAEASSFRLSRYADWHFDLRNAERALLEHLGAATLEGYGCVGLPLAIASAGALVQYLAETQRTALEQLKDLTTYSTSEFMILDPATRRNLELTQTTRSGTVRGSLLGVLDATRTAMGSRLLRQWLSQPLLRLETVQSRQEGVQAFYDDGPRRTALRDLLKKTADIERLTNRILQGQGAPRELLALRDALLTAERAIPLLKDMNPASVQHLELNQLDACPEVSALIAQAIVPDPPATLAAGEVIARGFSAELDGVLIAAHDAKNWVADLEHDERERTGIKNLRVGYNKVFGYYLEVTKSNLHAVPDNYIRKQTLVNGERFVTPELKDQETLILNAEERRAELEGQLYRQVCQQIGGSGRRLLATAQALARLDVLSTLAEVAQRHRYVRPLLNEGDTIHIASGRHPVIELSLHETPFVPNDVHLSPAEEIHVITGPNMSGKSTFLRQVALIVLMAQIGSFVPADKAEIGMVDRIFTRVGAQDELSAGQSTFMVEMVETANILNHATKKSLLILDEIGRGTSTYDGISIAWAVVEYIHNHPRLQSKTLFATHYHELIELARLLPRVRNYNVAVAEEGDHVVFLRRIVPGGADRSYGIHVANLAGLPKPVVRRAEEILTNLQEELQRSPVEAPRKRLAEARQLSLFAAGNPLVEELRKLDVASMSPLEAINKLFELQDKSKQD